MQAVQIHDTLINRDGEVVAIVVQTFVAPADQLEDMVKASLHHYSEQAKVVKLAA